MGGGRRPLLAAIGSLLALGGAALVVLAVAPQEPVRPPPTSVVLLPSLTPGSLGPLHLSDARGSDEERIALVLPRSKPVALAIPAIGVRSSLLSLGLHADGTVEVPSGDSYDEAGWYRYSPTPGSLGPAIILGHVSGSGERSVFYRLGELRAGNTVLVTRRDGSIAVFEVMRVRRYPKDHFPTDRVYGNTNHAALRLITCGGVFDFSTGHYVDNIIAFASLVGVR